MNDAAWESTAIVGVRIPLPTDVRNCPKIAAANADLIEAEALRPTSRGRVDAEREAALRELERSEEALARAETRRTLAMEMRREYACAFSLGNIDLPQRLRIEADAFDAELAGVRGSRHRAQSPATTRPWNAAMNHLRNIAPPSAAHWPAQRFCSRDERVGARCRARPAGVRSQQRHVRTRRQDQGQPAEPDARPLGDQRTGERRPHRDRSERAHSSPRRRPMALRHRCRPFATPTTYPLTITVTAGDESDLLAADFVVASETPGASPFAAGTTTVSGIGLPHFVRARRCGGRHHPAPPEGSPQ